jgi:hypothetical protein
MKLFKMEDRIAVLTDCLFGNSFSVSLKKRGTSESPSFSVQTLVCPLRFPIAATPDKAVVKVGDLLEKYNNLISLKLIKKGQLYAGMVNLATHNCQLATSQPSLAYFPIGNS